jgi:hypothetical protein
MCGYQRSRGGVPETEPVYVGTRATTCAVMWLNNNMARRCDNVLL